MPLAVWLLLGSVAAYLVFKSGQSAAATAALSPPSASVWGPQGIGPFSVPVESTLPLSLQSQLSSFFLSADQPSFTDQTVLDFSNQLAMQGYSIAANSVATAWTAILGVMAQSAPPSQPSSSVCPPGTHPKAVSVTERITLGAGPTCEPNQPSGISPIAVVPKVRVPPAAR